jgi:hypothetical protein
VVKTGQYRDHQIEEVLDRCFVMFVTRFNKGRPRGFPPDKEIYVCESRYNEEKFTFNKIKTWASCVPDEVRDKDYEMDLYDVPRRMKKIPSPIKHLLREDAKETDELPKPTWGSPNAPPIVGAVHRRPREVNVSEAYSFTSLFVCLFLCPRLMYLVLFFMPAPNTRASLLRQRLILSIIPSCLRLASQIVDNRPIIYVHF